MEPFIINTCNKRLSMCPMSKLCAADLSVIWVQIRTATQLFQSLSFSSFKHSSVFVAGTCQTPRPFMPGCFCRQGFVSEPWSPLGLNLSGSEQRQSGRTTELHWSHVGVSAVFKAPTSHLGEMNPRRVSNMRVSMQELVPWCIHCPGKTHAWFISLLPRTWSHRKSTVWIFSLLCEDNAGWGTGERMGVHSDKRKGAWLASWPSPSLRPLLFISGNTTQRKRAEILQFHFEELGARLGRERL